MRNAPYFLLIANNLLGFVFLWQNGDLPFNLPLATGPVSVMIVEETDDSKSLTSGQKDLMNPNGALKQYVIAHGEKDPWRRIDQDNPLNKETDQKWKIAKAAKGPTVPWLIVLRKEHVLLSEALPKEESEGLHDVQRYGGK